MKVRRFDGRWDNDELDTFLLCDGSSIHIKFITESDYNIRIYYDDITSFSSTVQREHYLQPEYAGPPIYPNYQQPYDGYTNQPNRDPISIANDHFSAMNQLQSSEGGRSAISTSFIERLWRVVDRSDNP